MDTAVNKSAAGTTAWHALAVDETLKQLATSTAKGLEASEASGRLQKYGPNRLPEGKKRGALLRFFSQLNNILVYVLLGAGFVKLMLGLWVDGAIILSVVLINALLGFIQEGKAEKALDSIRNMLSAEARTVRSGETRMLPAEELVPGDIVLLESGDKVPADLRLAEVKNLRTEEAALTGESVPADKNTDPVSDKATVGDRESMAFSGTMVVSGRATGVVVATGSETELGKINQLLASVSALETPLLRQIKKFGYMITAVIGVVSVLIFAYGKWVKGMDFVALFQAVIAIAVSVIPEGLPALITITLAIGVQRMAQRHAIIRRLPAVETLGSVSRICSDKTGTLTLMEMMVVSAATAESEYQITGNGYAPEGEIKQDGKPADKKDPVLGLLGRVSTLCNDAQLFQRDGAWKVEGDPTEGALYPFATKLGMDREAEAKAWARIDAIPFESEHKFMATLQRAASGEQVLLVKGAPEVILEHCDRQQTANGQPKPLDRERFAQVADKLAGQGERVLAAAWLENPSVQAGGLGPADLPKNLVLLGLIGRLAAVQVEKFRAIEPDTFGAASGDVVEFLRQFNVRGQNNVAAIARGRSGVTNQSQALGDLDLSLFNPAVLLESFFGGIEDENAGVTIKKDVVPTREAAAKVMYADDGGDIHRSRHDRGMRCLASLLGGKTKHERAINRGGVRRGEIPGDNNMWLVFGGDHARSLAEQVPNHPAGDVLDIDHALAKVWIVDGAERAAILLRYLMEGVFDIVPLFLKIAKDLIDEGAIFHDQKMRIKDPGILGPDRVGDSLLNSK